MSYFLNKDELKAITNLIGFGSVANFRYTVTNSTTREQKLKNWDREVFTHILKNQPELEEEYQKFKVLFTDNTSFAQMFDGKIDIKSTEKFLFNDKTFGMIAKDNKALYLSLYKNTKDFFPLLSKNINTNEDIFLELARKEPYSKELIENIKSIKNQGGLALAKKKTLTYLKLLPKTQETYDFILSEVPSYLKENVELNLILDDKFKSFPKEVIKKQKNTINSFEEKETYIYTFKISKDWMLNDLGIKQILAGNMIQSYYTALKTYLHQNNIKEGIAIKISELTEDIIFESDTIEKRDKIKNIVKSFNPSLASIFSNVNTKQALKNWSDDICEIMKSVILKDSLEQDLPIKSVAKKPKI